MAEYKARKSHNALEIASELSKMMAYESGVLAGESKVRGKVTAFLQDQEDKGHTNVNIDVLRKVIEC